MLQEFSNFITALDPDVLTGYNIINFDLPYIYERADLLGASDFKLISRAFNNFKPKLKLYENKSFGSPNYGKVSYEVKRQLYITGRVQFDLYPFARENFKLSDYKLQTVGETFLGAGKDDLHYTQIAPYYNQGGKKIIKLAKYCLKDSMIVMNVMLKKKIVTETFELCQVVNNTPEVVLYKGQKQKLSSFLHFQAYENNYLICHESKPHRPSPEAFYDAEMSDGQKKYKGAYVIEPTTGRYKSPVIVLDFASLYPSIIMEKNLCFSTLLKDNSSKNGIDEENIYKLNHHSFVTKAAKSGLLPKILAELLSIRKQAKLDMKRASEANDYILYDVYNAKQKAVKVIANSIYGLLGSKAGIIDSVPIAETITARGRELLQLAKDKAPEFCPTANVIYGDTDSIFINIPNISLDEGIQRGLEMERQYAKFFQKPIIFEYEKTFSVLLMLAKKRYYGIYFEKKSEGPGQKEGKGIHTSRRDGFPFLRKVLSQMQDDFISCKTDDETVENVRSELRKLYRYRKGLEYDINDFTYTTSLSKNLSEYKNENTPHCQALKRCIKKNSENPQIYSLPQYATGDRIAYSFIVNTHKKFKREKDCKSDFAECISAIQEGDMTLNFDIFILDIRNAIDTFLRPLIWKSNERNVFISRMFNTQHGAIQKYFNTL